MHAFSLLIGDYESAILPDRENCPGYPPPVKLRTALLFMNFRSQLPGEALLDPETNEQVKDKDGNLVYCRGGWRAEKTVDLTMCKAIQGGNKQQFVW